MKYVLASLTQFNNGHKSVIIKARGRAISRAVDVAEIVKRTSISSLIVKNISIATEVLKLKDKEETSNVSSISIELSKG